MNRSRKLVASVVLWPLPYPLVPSSYRCSVQQLIKDFESFWVLKTRQCKGTKTPPHIFDRKPWMLSLQDFPGGSKERRSSVFVRVSCLPPFCVEFYQNGRQALVKRRMVSGDLYESWWWQRWNNTRVLLWYNKVYDLVDCPLALHWWKPCNSTSAPG